MIYKIQHTYYKTPLGNHYYFVFYFSHVINMFIDIKTFVIIAWSIIIVLHIAILSASLSPPCFSPKALAHKRHPFLNQVIKSNFNSTLIILTIIFFPQVIIFLKAANAYNFRTYITQHIIIY